MIFEFWTPEVAYTSGRRVTLYRKTLPIKIIEKFKLPGKALIFFLFLGHLKYFFQKFKIKVKISKITNRELKGGGSWRSFF